MQWDVETDTFLFQLDLKQKPLTRRGILSTVSSLFDPLGLVAPVILEGKRIVQELCRDGKGWEDPIPDDVTKRWETWRCQLKDISKLRIPRCYKSHDCKDQELKSVELHHFADASLLGGYGQRSYIRLLREDGKIDTALVAAKAKVGPSKPVTVPRLELTAAVMSVKMSNFLRKELDYKDIRETFWSDSKVVLGYINNEARRFHVFVANRVQMIRGSTSPDQWHHIPTGENPADVASRGVTVKNLQDNQLWWKGPAFLSSPVIQPSRDVVEPKPNDPEMRKVKILATQAKPKEAVDMLSQLERFSSWHRMKRAVAICLRMVKGLRGGTIKIPCITGDLKENMKQYKPVDVAEMGNAELVIMKMVQAQAFKEEIAQLRKMNSSGEPPREMNSKENKAIGKRSGIYRLDPYVDKAGVLRVGGRVQRADVPECQKHPMVLPGKGHVVQVLIAHHHRDIAHSERGMTLNAILSAGYWLLKARTVITTYLQKCVICRKLRGAPLGQKMANLPEDRLQEVPPFTYSSVDYFGPYLIRQGRSDNKRYGAVFTCLNSRAIHIEVSNSLDTSSFLNAYRRFVCCRAQSDT
ncbi:uncharacterized protein LOC135482568 [Lineus longissimus]|uniref:uncharacterized protein LOC135482568 n=1 Tax=Lineus longissimus TaxID=88925 RepID=UPI00315DE5CE